MNNGLTVRDLTFRYGQKLALDQVSLEAPAGSFTALLGPNGAGKSTLIALLSGLIVAPGGQISVAGHDLARTPRSALAELGIVFQQPTLDLDLSVRQNLAYFAALHGLPRAGIGARIEAALGQLGMANRAGEKVRNLNGGHRRRMELARALLHDPKVLLLDEPTVGLDIAARQSITDHVHELARQGMSVLWTTHLTDEVRDDDRLVVLHQGRILADGIAGNIRGEESLSEWFLARTGGAA